MAYNESTIKKRHSWLKEVTSPTVEDGVIKLEDLTNSCYDMAVITVDNYEAIDGWVVLRIFGWENEETRDMYDV